MKLVTEVDTLEKSMSESITGVIFFDFNVLQFPENKWNDFVVIILCWWIVELESMWKGGAKSVELCFMDGPFFIRLTKLPNGICKVECNERKITGVEIKYTTECALPTVVRSVVQVAETVITECENNSWLGGDAEELALLVASFNQ